jgi:hypothetical protein
VDEVADGQQIAGRDESPRPVALLGCLFRATHGLDPSLPPGILMNRPVMAW